MVRNYSWTPDADPNRSRQNFHPLVNQWQKKILLRSVTAVQSWSFTWNEAKILKNHHFMDWKECSCIYSILVIAPFYSCSHPSDPWLQGARWETAAWHGPRWGIKASDIVINGWHFLESCFHQFLNKTLNTQPIESQQPCNVCQLQVSVKPRLSELENAPSPCDNGDLLDALPNFACLNWSNVALPSCTNCFKCSKFFR